MKNDNNKNHGSSAFFWGLIIGALLASLLTTKRGRRILRELSEIALDLIENFLEEKTTVKTRPIDIPVNQNDEVKQDLDSEITQTEIDRSAEDIREFVREDLKNAQDEGETEEVKSTPLKKKRLFRGIKRSN